MSIRDVEQTQIEEAQTVVTREDAVYCSLCNDPDPSTQTYEIDPIPASFAYTIAAGTIDEDNRFRASKYYRLVLCEDHMRELFGSVPPMRGYRVPYDGADRSATLAGQMEALNSEVGDLFMAVAEAYIDYLRNIVPVVLWVANFVLVWVAAGALFPFSVPAMARRAAGDDGPDAGLYMGTFVVVGVVSLFVWVFVLLPALGPLFGVGL